MFVKTDAAVVSEVLWHRLHPMLLNSDCPFSSDEVCVVGTGGAERRMNAAKLIMSEGVVLPPEPMLVWSSGVALNTQPAVTPRSFGKTSFDTPCSTLYASPAKISSDLFWAFQPKRVTVPSLPLVFRRPPIPSCDFS